jgi:ribosomal protein S15P/S13E
MTISKEDMMKLRGTDEEFFKSPGDPTISREDARNIAVQMKKIQDEERKNPKPTHNDNGLLIMEDDPFK